jgi:amino acid adenylation domain-containing protein
MTAPRVSDYLEESAARHPDRPAVVDASGHQVTYAELNRQADGLAAFLNARGVAGGDRVGVVLPKGIPAVVSLFGIMKAGAAYVPVDFTAPVERSGRILSDCETRALIVDSRVLRVIPPGRQRDTPLSAIVVVGDLATSVNLDEQLTPFEQAVHGGAMPSRAGQDVTDLAYILYTSGSTGMPKGVMITHRNVRSFVDWCTIVFNPTPDDRFSSHAPFHFDPSVFDLYVAMKHGASVHLIGENLGKKPEETARFIAERRLTVWCSTASALALLVQFGNLEAHDASSLRLVLSGGEVFPVKHLRKLRERWSTATCYNVYGPTETCVFCTLSRIPRFIPEDRVAPYPIGFPGAHCQALVLDAEGRDMGPGQEGLLHISGSPVFAGYWNRPAETSAAFLERGAVRWYNTGDVVRVDPVEGFIYVGRHDGMVKRRGFRIELGEIERALYLHPQVREAAAVSVSDGDASAKIVAFLVCHDSGRPSIVELKQFCAEKLPVYMSPDRFVFQDRLPRTSTDKVDYKTLRNELLDSRLAGGR